MVQSKGGTHVLYQNEKPGTLEMPQRAERTVNTKGRDKRCLDDIELRLEHLMMLGGNGVRRDAGNDSMGS